MTGGSEEYFERNGKVIFIFLKEKVSDIFLCVLTFDIKELSSLKDCLFALGKLIISTFL